LTTVASRTPPVIAEMSRGARSGRAVAQADAGEPGRDRMGHARPGGDAQVVALAPVHVGERH
jgi:hypothetical protein